MPGDYGFSSITSSSIGSGIDGFNFESGVNQWSNAQLNLSHESFKFKSRATKDTS